MQTIGGNPVPRAWNAGDGLCYPIDFMRLFILALLFLISACPTPQTPSCLISEPPPFGFGDAGPSTASNPNALVIFVGQSTTLPVEVAPSDTSECEMTMPMAPTSATTSVVGPDNLPVASTQTGLALTNGAYVDSLVFTPTQPGDYHLVATFEPDLGVAQLDVPAAFDRSSLPVQDTYDDVGNLAGCGQFLVTDLGTLLCASSLSVFAFRDGGQVDEQTGGMMAVHGSSIWIAMSNAQNVSHFIDTGTGALEPGSPPMVATPSIVTGLVPGDDDVLVLMSDRATLYTAIDGGFSQTQQWTGASFMTAAVLSDTQIIAYASDGSLYANTDGGTTLDELDGTRNLHCVAYGPEGLWMVDDITGVLEVFTPGSHSPTATLFGLTGWTPSGGSPLYGTAPTTIANQTQTFTATWDSTLNAPVLSMWGPNTSAYFVVNGEWSIARELSTGRLTVSHLSTP